MIKIMPETEGKMLAVEAKEKLTYEDYEEVFIPKLNQLIEKYGEIKVLMYLAEDFTGWEPEAAWDDAKFGLQHRNDFEKIAVVGGPKWVEWATRIGAYFTDGQVIIYEASDLQAAISWVKE